MAIKGVSNASQPDYSRQMQTDNVKTVDSYSGEDGSVCSIQKDAEMTKSNQDVNAEDSLEKQPSDETVKQTLSDINKRLSNTECKFGIHKETNRITIQIIDKDTNKVVKEIPPEKTLDMIAKAWELAGLLVDEKL